ncbi:4-hydroxy-tetrahydrodipicolinate reductase [Spirochaetia bacterium]|nr:4-hydroxy-tetrahydrodipicolinate reductase [Spirochaetia bacterium]
MKIGIIGYGKMGKMVEQAALSRGHQIAVVIDPMVNDTWSASGAAVSQTFSAETAADVFIEFTQPETAPGNISAVTRAGIPLVSGSTGWYEKLPAIRSAIEQAGASFLWSSNFSLGVNLFYRIAAYAAKLADPFAEYDVGGLEVHHNKKSDSPSGTAQTLMEQVLASMKRKTRVLWEAPLHNMEADTINFASLRYGTVPGTHSLFFDSPADTIEISHTARGREGFAAGALAAAEWLLRSGPGQQAGEARRGIFTMDDVLETK